MILLKKNSKILSLCFLGFFAGFLIIDNLIERPNTSIDHSIENYQYFFNRGAVSKDSLRLGWSHIEDWGVWSDANEAIIHLPIKKTPIKEISFDFMMQVFNGGNYPQNIEVYVHNHHAVTWSYPVKRNLHLKQLNFKLPKPLTSNQLKITFKISKPISPKDLHMSSDARKLGIGLNRISFMTKGLAPNRIVQ